MRQSCFPGRLNMTKNIYRLLRRLRIFCNSPRQSPAPHQIFSAIFHFNKAKIKRNKLPIPRMFPPMPINVLVLMTLRLRISVALYFRDALYIFTCYSFLSNIDYLSKAVCLCSTFLQHPITPYFPQGILWKISIELN